jgi:hypothetical protein
MPFKRKLVKQRVLLDLPFSHHRPPPAVEMRDYTASATPFFYNIAPFGSLLNASPMVSRGWKAVTVSPYSQAVDATPTHMNC